ncbi:MAG: molybdopterin-binding protein [Chloroflexota bacterium]|nr:molybdopterin-binding protein [Chloroflexota bacterium]
MQDGAPQAILLSIGTEILLGEIVDSNAAHLAGELARLGVELRGVHQLADDRATIGASFAEARSAADLVIATGGLGPTHDDLTREGLADALGEPLTPDQGLQEELRRRFVAYGPMPMSNLRQALRVPSAQALPNPIGSAPGWWVDRDGSVVVLLPGVPAEMRRMWSEEVVPRLEARFALRPLRIRTVKTFGLGESAVAEALEGLLDAPGHGISAGIYARDDGVHLRFSTREDAAVLEPAAARAMQLLGDHVYGCDADTLPAVALRALAAHGVSSLASLESGTAGALLAILAEADGSGVAYVGGVLTADGHDASAAPSADAVISLVLLPQDRHGRSRVQVSLDGAAIVPATQARIHGSGPQRQRRAAFAALDQVRRAFSD